MRRAAFLTRALLPIALSSGALTAQAVDPAEITSLIRQAIAGERNAQARYAAFAVAADAEGFHGVASLFRAAARAEAVHEARLTALLKKRGGGEPPTTEEPKIETTRENLVTAMAAEQAERDDSYHAAVEKAMEAGDQEAARLFDTCRTAEAEHANLLMSASWSLGAMKEKRAYFVCGGCGYTTDVDLPRGCPLCPKGRGRMTEID